MKTKLIITFITALLMTCIGPVSAGVIDAGKSITIGSGSRTVFEFTDPDCPFCRKAAKYFEGRKDVTRHIFFFPLPRHPKAKEKAQYILSQEDRSRAYHDVMSGRMDAVQSFLTTPRGIKLQQEQLEMAKKAKVSSTPTFIINGRIIEGFDLKKIEDALGGKP